MKWGAVIAIALGLVLAGSAIGSAFAQDPTESPARPSTNPAQPAPGPRAGRPLKALKVSLARQTAELTGLTPREVRDLLADGQSLSAIAAGHGSSEQAVIDAALARLGERLDQAVARGRISAEEKAGLLDAAREQAPALMNETGLDLPERGRGQPQGRPGGAAQRGRHLLVQATAEVTGLSAEEVRAEVRSGKSLEQIATEHGKTADDIIAVLRTRGEEQLDRQLERARDAISRVPGK
jgi:hypothetical protein